MLDVVAGRRVTEFFALVEAFPESPPQRPAPLTETRFGTLQGCGGHYQCRRIAVTLPYSGTIADAPDEATANHN
jgi:hypothetical protein